MGEGPFPIADRSTGVEVCAPVSKQSKFVFGVDLDGVCADFIGGLRPLAAEWLGVPVETLPLEVGYGLTEWGLERVGGRDLKTAYANLHRWAVTQRALFRSLEPIPNAAVTLRRLAYREDIRIRIITHRLFIGQFHQTAISQTVEWLDQYGFPYYDLCFMESKSAVGADLYIEDSPANITALRKAGAKVIVYTNAANRHMSGVVRANDWSEVETLVLRERDRWAQAQARA